MANNNNVIQSQEMINIIIETDPRGHNVIISGRNLKYHRLINNRNAAYILRKNIVIVDNEDVINTIIEADNCGNNTIKSFDEYAKEEIDSSAGNIFKDLLKKNRQKKAIQESLITVYLSGKRESLQEKLRKATEYYKDSLFVKSNELYENALNTIECDNYPDEFMLDDCDIFAIKFASVLSKIGMNNYPNLRSAEEILRSLIQNYGATFPSLYYYLAKILCTTNSYEIAKKYVMDGLKILESVNYIKAMNWPGTTENMEKNSSKCVLEQDMLALFDQCTNSPAPDAKCFYNHCSVEHYNIYFDSVVFAGYVRVQCTNKCNFTYHRACWKKKLKSDGIKKPNTLIDKICPTNDCLGEIKQIIIYDETLKVLCTIDRNIKKDQSKVAKNDCTVSQTKPEKRLKTVKDKNKGVLKQSEDKLDAKQQIKKDGNTSSTSVVDKQDLSSLQNSKPTVETDKMFQTKTFTFNTNAEEYIPSNYKLRHNDNISNNLILTEEENGKRIIHSNLNLNAEEYVPPSRVINMIQEVHSCEQATQCTENVVNQTEYEALKCDINILQAELFKTEENYNSLISQFDLLKINTVKETNDIWTETEATNCENCEKLETDLKITDDACRNISALENGTENIGILSYVDTSSRSSCTYFSLNQQLDLKIRELKHEINELRTSWLLDRENFTQKEKKLLDSNRVLVGKIQEAVLEKEKFQRQVNEMKVMNESSGTSALQKILLEQIGYIRSFYLSYIGMFENKCKHMIWELEDIKILTSADSLPSRSEIEENLIMWRQSLNIATKNHGIVMMFYDKLLSKFTNEPYENLFPAPIPNLIPEPSSVILRHFKSFFLINKRLEQDVNKHLANYYKMLSMPYPGVFPYGMSHSPVSSQSELLLEPALRVNVTPTETEGRVLQPPPGLSCEPAVEAPKEVSTVSTENNALENVETTSSSLNISSVSEEKVPEVLSNIETNPVETPVEKETVKYDTPLEGAVSLPLKKQDKENKALVVGPDALLFKLQQKYPITPARILQEAVKTVRCARGGLTGIDSKTLMNELRISIADLSKKDRQKPGYQKINVREKLNPWAPINNPIQWQNQNGGGNCAICFEKLYKNNSTQLRCQHIFHTACIKTWLQTNGICPICRSFTTLDDEFPPLK